MDTDYDQKMHQRYGAPLLTIHKADLQLALINRAKELGVEFRLGDWLKDVNSDVPEVITISGERFPCDLVVGADGLWSRCRECFLGTQDKPNATGDLYRIMLRLKDIPDQDLRDLVAKPGLNFWLGPDCRVIAYSIRSGELYNSVLLRPDDLPAEVAKREGSTEEMKALFANWDPTCVPPAAFIHIHPIRLILTFNSACSDSWALSLR